MMWHVIAKNKPEDLKGHSSTSTANVIVPKTWLLKACSEAICNTANQFGDAMGSQLRAHKDGFRIRSLSQDFQDPRRSTELKNWTILTKQVLFSPPKKANYCVT